jgi:hypothetical protein
MLLLKSDTIAPPPFAAMEEALTKAGAGWGGIRNIAPNTPPDGRARNDAWRSW